MAKTRVIVTENHVKQWGDALEKGLVKGLEATGREAQGKIRAAMTRVGPEGVGVSPNVHVRDSIKVGPVMRNGTTGLFIWVYSGDPNALWQEKGTHGKKGKAKTARTAARRKAAGGGSSGVKPLRFFARGTRATNVASHLWRYLP